MHKKYSISKESVFLYLLEILSCWARQLDIKVGLLASFCFVGPMGHFFFQLITVNIKLCTYIDFISRALILNI